MNGENDQNTIIPSYSNIPAICSRFGYFLANRIGLKAPFLSSGPDATAFHKMDAALPAPTTLRFPSVCGETDGNPKAQPSDRQEQAGSRRRFVFFILFNGFFGLQPIPVLCHEKDAGENEGDGNRFHQRE